MSPRGLYGRAALILIVPIVVLQLVVSLVFLQRHFEGVTQQMTRNLLLEIAYVLEGIDKTETDNSDSRNSDHVYIVFLFFIRLNFFVDIIRKQS